MGNTEENDGNSDGATLIGKTIKDNDSNSTALVIPKEFAKALGTENSNINVFAG